MCQPTHSTVKMKYEGKYAQLRRAIEGVEPITYSVLTKCV